MRCAVIVNDRDGKRSTAPFDPVSHAVMRATDHLDGDSLIAHVITP
jgi:hypothetical protein